MFSPKARWPISICRRICRLATMAVISALTLVSAAPAQTFAVLHSFTGGSDGSHPTGLAIDQGGNLYGASRDYPDSGNGLIFKMTGTSSGWTVVPIHNFGVLPGDGIYPNGVVIAPNGRLFGTTTDGGSGGFDGFVFSLAPPPSVCRAILCPWLETSLTDLGPSTFPNNADLAFDQSGNIYGTTPSGGNFFGNCPENGCGTVYELLPGQGGYGVTYYQFSTSSGYAPSGGVVLDSAGNLYGPAGGGGSEGCGTIYELQSVNGVWTQTTLFNFNCASNGAYPSATLLRDSSGNLYGSTANAGAGNGGTVFELTPSGGGWTFNLIYSFSGNAGPSSALTSDAAGNLYGTTRQDGAFGFGNVFKLTPNNGSWTYTSLYDFTDGSDGGYPSSKILFDAQGNLYGSAFYGGNHNCSSGCGVVFKITP